MKTAARLAVVALSLSAAAAQPGEPGAVGARARGYAAFLEAQTLLMTGRPEEAAQLLDRAVLTDPDPGLLLQAAEMHRLLGEPDAAMRLVDRALQGRPAWPEALVLRASIRIDGAETLDATTRAAAIADLRLALAADRGSAEGARRLAEICSGEDCAAEAARVLEAQAETSPLPSDRALLLARLHLQLRDLGCVYGHGFPSSVACGGHRTVRFPSEAPTTFESSHGGIREATATHRRGVGRGRRRRSRTRRPARDRAPDGQR